MNDVYLTLEPAPTVDLSAQDQAPIVLDASQPAVIDLTIAPQVVTVEALPAPELPIVLEVGQGPAGPPGGAVLSTPFAFGDATPVDLGSHFGVVVSVSIVIIKPFNGVAPELAITSPAQTLLGADQNLPGEVGRYEVSPCVRLPTPTPLQLSIKPGIGCTDGGGIVYLEIVT